MSKPKDTDQPQGPLNSLATAHTLALATLVDILVRDGVIDRDEIIRAFSKLAREMRKDKKLGVTGPISLEKIVDLVRTSRGTKGRA